MYTRAVIYDRDHTLRSFDQAQLAGIEGLRAVIAPALPPSACRFVADLAENVAAARSVGMRACQIDRSLPVDDPNSARISTLPSLRGLLPPPSARD